MYRGFLLLFILLFLPLLPVQALSWQSVAIGGGGFITGMTASTTGTAVYIRTDVGGAYRWDWANTRWLPITDSLPNDSGNTGPTYGIDSIAVDPNNANRVFISSGKYSYSNPSGIYVSNDTSVAMPIWTSIDPTIRACANGGVRQVGERLAVDPYNSSVVYYGTDNVSVSGGRGLKKYYYDTSWHASTIATPAVGDTNAGITFVAVDGKGGSVSDGVRTVAKYIYIGVFSGSTGNGGVFASSDGGASWTKATGAVVDKPYRGEVARDGTLYVTFDGSFGNSGGVVKLVRGATALTAIHPEANLRYCALAVDPTAAGTVMVAEYDGSSRLWRSTTSGSSWVLMNRTINVTEPDGTPSVTAKGAFMRVSDLMINPANPREVWATDLLGVQRTQNIQDTTTASIWYQLQRNIEEICTLDIKCAPSGAPLLSGVADDNGYVHKDPSVRPTRSDQFDNPGYISSTAVDYSAGTSGSNTVWARVGDIYYYTSTDSDRTGGVSLNDGQSWISFGQVDAKTVTNGTAAGWETFDVGPYLKQQRASGIKEVTLCVRASSSSSHTSLAFSSKEGANPPQLAINGTASIPPSADAYVLKSGSNTNYGNSAQLHAQSYYDQAGYTRRSYLKFDLTNYSTITSATLRLYRLASTTDATAYPTTIYATPTTSWVENTITWNNMPVNFYAPPSGAQGGRVALSTSDPAKIVWACENGNVYYTKDRGVSWSRAMSGTNGMWVDMTTEFKMNRSALTADRVAADTFYLYFTAGSGMVYRSTDGGANWSIIAYSIGNVDAAVYSSGYRLSAVPGMSGAFWFSAESANKAAYFKYWNGSSMVSVPGISSVVDFGFGKAATGRSNPTVYARKADGTYWYSCDATAGLTYTWSQINIPTLNNQPCLTAGDQQTVGRLYVGTNGRGIFFTDVPLPTYYTISANSSPSGSGSVTGAGIYQSGSNVTVTAAPLSGYGFAAWTESGTSVSTSGSYSVSVVNSRELVANFQPAALKAWKSDNFTVAEQADSTISGNLADPDGNGFSNLMEYALGMKPKTGSLPPLLRQEFVNGYLTLTYSRSKTPADITYIVEVSSDLKTWNSGLSYTFSPVVTMDTGFTQTVQVSDRTPVTSGTQRFIRMRVTAP